MKHIIAHCGGATGDRACAVCPPERRPSAVVRVRTRGPIWCAAVGKWAFAALASTAMSTEADVMLSPLVVGRDEADR